MKMKKKNKQHTEILERIEKLPSSIPGDLTVALTSIPKIDSHVAAFQIQRTLHQQNDKNRVKNGLGKTSNLEKNVNYLKNMMAIELMIGNNPTELGTTIGLGFIGSSVLFQAGEGLFPPLYNTLTNSADNVFNKLNKEARELADDIQKETDKLADKVKKET